MIASLAEQVLSLVRTATRGRFSVGRAWPCGPENPWEVVWKGTGVNGSPVTGSVVGYLSLNDRLLERLAGGRARPRDHVGHLARDVQVAAAVVADVEHEVARRRRRRAGRRRSTSCASAVAMWSLNSMYPTVARARRIVSTFCTGVEVTLAATMVTVRGVDGPEVEDRERVGASRERTGRAPRSGCRRWRCRWRSPGPPRRRSAPARRARG